MTARVSHKARNPRKKNIKRPKSSSKVGFGGIFKVGQKVGPEVGFPLYLYMKTYFRTYFLTYFEIFPRNLLLSYFSATLFIFFRGFLALWLTRAVTIQALLREKLNKWGEVGPEDFITEGWAEQRRKSFFVRLWVTFLSKGVLAGFQVFTVLA